jgi:hypothetical protein
MKLLHNVNLTKTKILLMLQCKSGLSLYLCLCGLREKERKREKEKWVSSHIHFFLLFWLTHNCVVSLWFSLFLFVNFRVDILDSWHIHTIHNTHISTETKDWLQRFQETVQRNLHNWWKCVGTKIPINVLYPLSSQSLNLLKLCLFWFVKFTLTNSHIYWREVKWVFHSFSFLFSIVDCCVPWFVKHTSNTNTNTHELKELWNNLCNVATTMKWCVNAAQSSHSVSSQQMYSLLMLLCLWSVEIDWGID